MGKNDYLKTKCPHCGIAYQVVTMGTSKTATCVNCNKDFEQSAHVAVMTRQLRRALARKNEKEKTKQ